MTRSRNEAPDRWFIQIKGQTIGPMPAEKVLVRLLEGEITVLSRVSQDRTNWRAICNTPQLEELVNERIRVYAGKTEAVGQIGHSQQDDDILETNELNLEGVQSSAIQGISEQLDHARQLEELTANIQKLNQLRKEFIQNKRTVTVEKDSHEETLHPEDQNVFIPKAQNSSGLSQLLKRLKSGDVASRRLAIGSGILLLGGLLLPVAYYGYEYFTAPPTSEQIVSAGESYTEAAQQLEAEAGKLPNSNPEELLKLAEEHLNGKRPKQSQDLSRQVLAMNVSGEIKAQAHTLIAAAAEQMGQTEVAITEYSQAIKSHEIHSALHNLGVLQLKSNKSEEAERLLIKAIQVAAPQSISRTLSLLTLFEAARLLDETNPQSDRLNAVAPFLDEELKANTPLRAQVLLAKLYIAHAKAVRAKVLPSAQSEFQLAAVEFIDQPLDLIFNPSIDSAQNEFRDLAVTATLEVQYASWRTLVRRCASIYNQPPVSAFTAAVYSACLSRSHGATNALPFAKYANDLVPNDPVFGGLYAAILVQGNQKEAARLYLEGHAGIADLSKQAAAVQAHLQPPQEQNPTTSEAAKNLPVVETQGPALETNPQESNSQENRTPATSN